jgi:hypothetical protein
MISKVHEARTIGILIGDVRFDDDINSLLFSIKLKVMFR